MQMDQSAGSAALERLEAFVGEWSIWELSRTSPDFSPLDFSQRFTGRVGDDGNTIQGRWETSDDGSRWEHDFDLTYTKVK
jgi:hypothetical protein